jgi:hypothetical protein
LVLPSKIVPPDVSALMAPWLTMLLVVKSLTIEPLLPWIVMFGPRISVPEAPPRFELLLIESLKDAPKTTLPVPARLPAA